MSYCLAASTEIIPLIEFKFSSQDQNYFVTFWFRKHDSIFSEVLYSIDITFAGKKHIYISTVCFLPDRCPRLMKHRAASCQVLLLFTSMNTGTHLGCYYHSIGIFYLFVTSCSLDYLINWWTSRCVFSS